MKNKSGFIHIIYWMKGIGVKSSSLFFEHYLFYGFFMLLIAGFCIGMNQGCNSETREQRFERINTEIKAWNDSQKAWNKDTLKIDSLEVKE